MIVTKKQEKKRRPPKEKEREKARKRNKMELAYLAGRRNEWHRAYNPELNVSGAGKTEEKAVKGMVVCMRVTAKYIIGNPDEKDNESRLEAANLVLDNYKNLEKILNKSRLEAVDILMNNYKNLEKITKK